MSLTQEKIKSLKKLTALSSGESLSIDSVLGSFQSLEKLDIDPNMQISRSGQGSLIPREDRISSLHISDELLACSPQRVVAHQISLSSIMRGE
jgi:Asp-tRNA(Asn)/Glu-tRNA(Gln) amidotransferase C subunit